MDISIVGSGAMGLLWAWRLERAGHRVRLICRNDSAVRAIADGVKLTYRGGEERVVFEASSEARIVRDSRYIFLWVKSYDTREAALSVAPYLDTNMTIVTLQNGLGNVELIAEQCPGTRIIAGTTTAAAYLEGGTLHAVSLGGTTLGLIPVQNRHEQGKETGPASRMAPANPDELAGLLSHAGLASLVRADTETAIWEKAAINAAINPLCALLGVKNGALVNAPSILALQAAITEEAARAAAFRGVALDREALVAKAQSVCEATAANSASMLMDVRRGNKTEIDALNGAIVKITEQEGGAAPVNKTITALIHALENSA